MSLNESYDLSRINQKRPDAMLVQLNKMQAQIEEMYSAIASGANTTETDLNSHINNTSNPHSVTKSQAGLGNVDNYATASQAQMEAGTAADKFATAKGTKQAIDKQIKGTSWIQENGLYIATDQIRARDSGGLILGDDAGQGPVVNDGGIVTNAYQPGFNAYITSTQSNVTGGNVTYNITGSIFTERHDIGSNFTNGTFTAPISAKRYYHGIRLAIDLGDDTFNLMSLRLITSNEQISVFYGNANTLKYIGNGYYYDCWHISEVDMDLSDTAYWEITVFGGTQVADIITGTTIYGGLAN